MAERIGYRIADLTHIIEMLGTMHGNPLDSFREYTDNSVDGRIEGRTNKILALVSKKGRCINLTDTGSGMTYNELRDIPQMIGDSSRRGIKGKIGEHQVGMLSYLQISGALRVISRKKGETGQYSFLKMAKKESPFLDKIDEDEARVLGFQPIEHGTSLIFDRVPEHIIGAYFTPGKLSKFLSEMYSPILRNGEVEISVGYLGKGKKLIECHPLRHKGEPVLEDNLEIEYRKDGETKTGTLDVLLFLNKDGTDERIIHYHEGTKISNLINISQFTKLPWNTGKLSGEVNENFLPLNSPKNAVLESKRLKTFCGLMQGYESDLSRQIEKISVRKKNALERYAEDVLKKLNDAYRDFAFRLPVLTIGRQGDLEREVKEIPGIAVTRFSGKGGTKEENKRKIVRPTTHDEEGKIKPIRDGRKTLSDYKSVAFDSFDIEEKNKRSRIGLGGSLIRINTIHPDYVQLEKKGTEKNRQEYVAMLMATEVANRELQEAIKHHRMTEDEAKEWGKDLSQQLLWYIRK